MAHESNISSKLTRFSLNQTWTKQKGAALILIAFILGLGAAVFILKTYNATNAKAKLDEQTYQTLGQAKQALIAWSASHSKKPGQMPFPDRNADGNYDGNSDCNSPASTFSYSFLIGQLPVFGQTNPCVSPQVGIGEDFKDAQGNRLWYAVSRNLMHKYETLPVTPTNDPVINPDVMSNPVYPWLKVLDSNGSVMSDRVAVIIIAPGNAIGTQNRSAAAPNPNQYLDSFIMSGTTYSNSNYLIPDQAFVMGQDDSTVSVNDARFVKPYYFNDKLVYITIDELMAALNNRASSEVSHFLNQYKAKTGQFPYAAALGTTFDNYVSLGTSQKGMVPIDGTDTCVCESQLKCTCSFKPITKVTFTRGAGTWAASTLGCSRYSANCTCTGAGGCTQGAEYFTCDAAGTCNHNVSGSNSYVYTVPSYADIKVLSGGCYISGKQAMCNDAANLQIGLEESSWFKDNLWQDFYYYEWSSASDLKFGQHGGLSALLINVGGALTNEFGVLQARPSSNISDYLDSVENANNDNQFDAMTKRKSANYNDQPFIVAP